MGVRTIGCGHGERYREQAQFRSGLADGSCSGGQEHSGCSHKQNTDHSIGVKRQMSMMEDKLKPGRRRADRLGAAEHTARGN